MGQRVSGVLFYTQDQSIYTGQFHGPSRHGYGVYRLKNGASYFGEWKYDKMDGVGVYYYEDNQRKYEG
jgi:hypothetical protein